MYIIEVPGYSEDDQINILKDFELNKILRNYHLDRKQVILSNTVAKYIVRKFSLKWIAS